MNRKLRIAAIATLLATAGIGAGVALADGDGRCGPMGSMGSMGKDIKAMADDRLVKLHADLKLTPEQEPAWAEFRTAIAAQAGKAGEHLRKWRDGPQPVSAIERLERGQQRLDDGRQALADVTTATKRFYVTLSKEQQTRFDDATRRFGHHGRHFGA